MKFREFVSWCNQRATDGCWGMLEAMVCVDIIETVRKERFWKREKFWKEKYADDVLELENEPDLIGNMWNMLTKTRIHDWEERFYWEEQQMSIFDFLKED